MVLLIGREKLHSFAVALRHREDSRHFLFVCRGDSVFFPYFMDVHENRRIIRAAAGSEDAYHLECVVVLLSLVGKAVDRMECIADLEACEAYCFASDDSGLFFPEALAFRDGKPWRAGLVRLVGENGLIRSDDTEAPVIVPEGERIDRLHLARVFKLIHFRVRNISYRPVAKEDRIQHKLVRGSLGPDEDGKRPDGMVDALIEPVCHLQEKNGHGC